MLFEEMCCVVAFSIVASFVGNQKRETRRQDDLLLNRRTVRILQYLTAMLFGPLLLLLLFAGKRVSGLGVSAGRRFTASRSLKSPNRNTCWCCDKKGSGNGKAQAIRLHQSVLYSATSSSEDPPITSKSAEAVGLYRSFCDRAWTKLQDRCGNKLQPVEIPQQLSFNTAIAAGAPERTRVDITVQALQAAPNDGSAAIRYARFALLETVSPSTSSSVAPSVQSSGIQVLNMVVFPASHLDFPVWGADFVSLPGNKHLLLLDAQPMGYDASDRSQGWDEWYQKNQIAREYPWGGDLPEKVQPYVSKNALWARLGAVAGSEEKASATVDPIERIQALMPAFEEHLDLYLDLIVQEYASTPTSSENRHRDYIQYRLENDPARPMLKRLYGEEWTETVLHDVLFPQS